MKEVIIKYKSNKGGLFGFAGVGKSSALEVALGKKKSSIRISTACFKVPVRAMAHMRITGSKTKEMNELTHQYFTKMVTNAARNKSKPEAQNWFLRSLQNTFNRPAEITDDVVKDLVISFYQLDEQIESLENEVVCEMRDCGGQPQFLEILPRFMKGLSLGILVTDLSQRLDEHPINYYYDNEGKSVGEGVRSSLSNEQVLRLCLRMVASQSRGEKPVRFVFVGTHRDLEHQCSETRQEKNRKLMEMVRSLDLEANVIYRSKDEVIFALNAKEPGEEDYKTAGLLGELMMDESTAMTVEMPVKYYSLELTLKRMVRESGQVAFKECDILKEVAHYHFTEESLKEALRFLHEMKLVFYFEEEFPGVVIGDPQAVLNKETEVVAHHIKLTTNPHYQQLPLDGKWRKFIECGILHISCLKEFPGRYFYKIMYASSSLYLHRWLYRGCVHLCGHDEAI